jgi:1-aminocyclopropane-1-carboxylate deaminase
MSFFNTIKTENIRLEFQDLNHDLKIFMKREDLIHPIISGNKFRKLKYNLKKLKKNKNSLLITFGGAFSNHLLAVAYLGKIEGIKTLAIVRGEELKDSKAKHNFTKMF